jgi:hypothetical protein
VREDLLDAQASIKWAESNFLGLQAKLENWLQSNVTIEKRIVPPPATHDPIVAFEKEALPRQFNAEVGAYINAIRSSLDMLMVAVAQRRGLDNATKAAFPIAENRQKYLDEQYYGAKVIRRLPDEDRAILDDLKPYFGGHDELWVLHQLDVMRKHKRLIGAETIPLTVSISGAGAPQNDFVQVKNEEGWLRVGSEVIVGLMRKGAPDYHPAFRPSITLSEPDLMRRVPVLAALIQFADTAASILASFDL